MAQVRTGQIYEFDGFQLYVDERLLLRSGERVALHGKAFEMLLVLVRNRGRLLTKDELFGMVWPDQIVEESNLTVNMSAIRRALGERANSPRYITTVSGRGYRFTDDVRETVEADDELTVERETFTRVVVEQEEETDTPVAGAANIVSAVALLQASEGTRPGVAIASGTAIAPGLAAGSEAASSRRRARQITFLLGVLFLVAVAAGAIWLYQSRTQRPQTVASTPPPQITMRRFTTAGGVPYRVGLSPDGKSLVYLQRIKGKDLLWLGQVETNSSVQINQPSDSWYGFGFGFPVFAPDGNSIYFTLLDDNHPRRTLLRMPVVGGALTELIQNVHSPITFSPDGRQLAFLREDREINQNSIIIADADGQRERTLVARRNPERFSGQGLSWSPDGKTIAVGAARADKREELLAVSVSDGSISKIASRDWGDVGNLVWLPDASGVVLAAEENVTPRGYGQIWLVTYPEGAVRKVTNDVNYYQIAFLSVSADGKLSVLSAHMNPEIWIAPDGDARQGHRVLQGVQLRFDGMHGLAWTPDGRLLYIAYVGESQTIWAMNSDGSNQHQLTSSVSGSSVDNQVSVTPDGRYMVFHSNRSGGSEIWRANTDGSDLKQLTTGGGNWLPSLSPDGQWILYTSGRDGKETLWRIPIEGGEATQVTARRLSFPEVSPDGKWIACIDPTTLPRWRLTVIPFAGGAPVKSFAVPRSATLQRRPRWTPDGKAIMYMDSYLGLWRQALDEAEPQLVKGFEDVRVFQFIRSFDGKNLAYTTGVETREIILIENFR